MPPTWIDRQARSKHRQQKQRKMKNGKNDKSVNNVKNATRDLEIRVRVRFTPGFAKERQNIKLFIEPCELRSSVGTRSGSAPVGAIAMGREGGRTAY